MRKNWKKFEKKFEKKEKKEKKIEKGINKSTPLFCYPHPVFHTWFSASTPGFPQPF